MATQLAHGAAPPAVPFMLRKPSRETGRGFAAALKRAPTVEQARGDVRSPRQRIALLLCELGKASGCRSELPLSRSDLAGALGISLVRVKRTLALLCLSGVIRTDGETIAVLDWRKLSGAARFDPCALGLGFEEEDEFLLGSDRQNHADHLLTASGEPACFV